MKKINLVLSLILTCSSVSAFQFEVMGSINDIELETDNIAASDGTSRDYTGTYYFQDVNSDTPYETQAFVEKASSVSVTFSSNEFENSGGITVSDAESLNIAASYITDSGIMLSVSYDKADTELGIIDTENLGIGVEVGYYVDDLTLMSIELTKIDLDILVDGMEIDFLGEETTEVGLNFQNLIFLSEKEYLSLVANATYVEFDRSSTAVFSVQPTLYLSKSLGFGAIYRRSFDNVDGDNDTDTTIWGASVNYYFSEKIATGLLILSTPDASFTTYQLNATVRF